MAAQELGSKGQVSVSAVPKHSTLLGPNVCQIKTCRILTLVKTTAQQGAGAAPQFALDTCFFFPRNPKFSSVLLRSCPKHPLHPGGKDNSRKPFLGTMIRSTTMNCTLRIPSPPFSSSPSTPVPLFSQPQA